MIAAFDDTETDHGIYVGILIFGLIPYVLLFTHLWSNDYMVYPLERQIFLFPIYKPLFTPTFTLLNRRILEVSDEIHNIKLKNGEDSENIFLKKYQDVKRLSMQYFAKSPLDQMEEERKKKAENKKRNTYDKSQK